MLKGLLKNNLAPKNFLKKDSIKLFLKLRFYVKMSIGRFFPR